MIPVSIVIITKNEAEIIGRTISKAKEITDDIIIIDSYSTDGTAQIATNAGCKVYQKHWQGYAANKNKGIELAKYHWILSLDADEIPDDELITRLHTLKLDDMRVVYDIPFRSYFGARQIRFGKWGCDHHVRLFNRILVKWYNSPVHETLMLAPAMQTRRLKGHINHFSVKDSVDFKNKSDNYARLNAQKYFLCGKKSSFVKLYLSPAFSFVKNYLFRLGFLDGVHGWEIAISTFEQTRLKYSLLQDMEIAEREQRLFIDQSTLVKF